MSNYLMNTYARFPIKIQNGKGAYLWDDKGKKYLDFVAGIAVCNLGHCHDELLGALTAQAEKLWHVSNLYEIEIQEKLAKILLEIANLDKAFFCNSGAEANEGAIKLARKYFYRKKESIIAAKKEDALKYPDKNEIIVFENSFHGRTLATLTATGQNKYQQGFAPLVEGFKYARFNDLASVKNLINEKTCAIMLEPIQGEGGIKLAELDFLKALQALCQKNDLLLIFDEVQCGMGRSGEFFAWQAYGVKPNIMTLAKGLGGGFPIGAILADNETASGFAPGDHASTFGGNPLACAVAAKVVEIISEASFLPKLKEKSKYLAQALAEIQDDRIVEIRGKGMMWGLEFDQEIKELLEICIQEGLLLIGAGANVLRLVPPLNLENSQIDQAIGIIKSALKIWQT